MKSFHEWLQSETMLGRWWQKKLDARNAELAAKDAKREFNYKVTLVRQWLFNKKGQAPVTENDPDFRAVMAKAEKLGPLDPNWNPNADSGPWGYGAGVNPGA